MGELKSWGKAVSELFPSGTSHAETIAKGVGGTDAVTIAPDMDGDLTSGSITSDHLTVSYDPPDWSTTLEVRGAPVTHEHITSDMIFGSYEWGRRIERDAKCEVNDKVLAGAEDTLAIIEKRCGIRRTRVLGGSVTGSDEELGKSAVMCGAQMGAGDVIWEIRRMVEIHGIRDLNDLLDTLARIESEWNIEGKIRKEFVYKK